MQTSGRRAASLWGCHVHNVVNERLGKEAFDCAGVEGAYGCGCAEEGKEGEKKGGKKVKVEEEKVEEEKVEEEEREEEEGTLEEKVKKVEGKGRKVEIISDGVMNGG